MPSMLVNYVSGGGFGHEDWNFNTGLAEDGFLWGYTRAEPGRYLRNNPFVLVLAIWDGEKGWQAVGYYRNAHYLAQGAGFSEDNARIRADHLLEMAKSGHLRGPYDTRNVNKLTEKINEESKYYCWKVAIEDVFVFPKPVVIPRDFFDPGVTRMTISFNFSEAGFRSLLRAAGGNAVSTSIILAQSQKVSPDGSDSEFPEGALIAAVHKRRERNPRLIFEAKRLFREQHGTLHCEVCGFDFQQKYGEEYIEAHHNVPVSSFEGRRKVSVDELSMVCANCHRMLHRRRPWLSVDELRSVIRKPCK